MSQQEKVATKGRLMGMKVINAEGNSAGIIKDVTFAVGIMDVTLIVEKESGEQREVPVGQIQAAGDVILLKASQPETQSIASQPVAQMQLAEQPPTCPTCKGALSYVLQYQRWYCYKCQQYT